MGYNHKANQCFSDHLNSLAMKTHNIFVDFIQKIIKISRYLIIMPLMNQMEIVHGLLQQIQIKNQLRKLHSDKV